MPISLITNLVCGSVGRMPEWGLARPLTCFDKEPNTVAITLTLAGADPWWQMTRPSQSDSPVRQWWNQTDELATNRSRPFAPLTEDVETLSNA
jgi:hypothetical protein